MIDIMIQPSQVEEAKKDIKWVIRNYNYRNQWRMIELRDSWGRFMPDDDWFYVIDNRDRSDGEFFIRVEFEDDYKIHDAIMDHFGEFNVGCC